MREPREAYEHLSALSCSSEEQLAEYVAVTDEVDIELYSGSETLLKIWLDYAALLSAMGRDEEEVRSVYKHVRAKRLCIDREELYTHWAGFEEQRGHLERAANVLRLGYNKIGTSALFNALENLKKPRYSLGPPQRTGDTQKQQAKPNTEQAEKKSGNKKDTPKKTLFAEKKRPKAPATSPLNKSNSPLKKKKEKSSEAVAEDNYKADQEMNSRPLLLSDETAGAKHTITPTKTNSENTFDTFSSFNIEKEIQECYNTCHAGNIEDEDSKQKENNIESHYAANKESMSDRITGLCSSLDESLSTVRDCTDKAHSNDNNITAKEKKKKHASDEQDSSTKKSRAPKLDSVDVEIELGVPIRIAPTREPEKSNTDANQTDKKELNNASETASELVLLETNLRKLLVNGRVYHLLSLIGKGGSSKVFRALDENGRIVAIKRVSLRNLDRTTLVGYTNEIELLTKLKGSSEIIELLDYAINDDSLILVLENGETDLARVLEKERVLPINALRYMWQQLLTIVGFVHKQRIVHCDLKPANFVFVKGRLKLIDFGIAKSAVGDTTSIVRENQVGTVNYMAPEAVEEPVRGRHKLNRASDVWSLGCIFYEMAYGSPPLSTQKTIVAKLQKLLDANCEFEYPQSDPQIEEIIRSCLRRSVSERPSISHLLSREFFKPKGYSVERCDLECLVREVLRMKNKENIDYEEVSRAIVDAFITKRLKKR